MSNYNLKSVGEALQIYEPVTLIKSEQMSFGHHVMLSEFVYLAGGQGLYVGNYVHLSTHVSILGGGVCVLGDFVTLAAGSRVITGTDNVLQQGISSSLVPDKYRNYTRSYVIVEKHAFIATNVVIHPGVTIGEGAVIGSGSLVTKDVKPWTVNVGTPLKKIKDRDKEPILALEKKLMSEVDFDFSDYSFVTELLNG